MLGPSLVDAVLAGMVTLRMTSWPGTVTSATSGCLKSEVTTEPAKSTLTYSG